MEFRFFAMLCSKLGEQILMWVKLNVHVIGGSTTSVFKSSPLFIKQPIFRSRQEIHGKLLALISFLRF